MSDQTPEPVIETSSPSPDAPKPDTKRRLFTPKRVGTGLSVGGLVLALGLGGLYMGRRAVAEEVLVGWLHRRGIQADVEVQRIEWDGFTGRITVGDPKDPDVRIERVEVDYLIGLPWMADGFGLTPKRVLLDKPLVKAEWTGKALSFGSLDPLIKEFTSRPPGPKKPGPVIIVNQGQALLATPYGAITATADARVNDERLEWLKASLNPADLKLNNMQAQALAVQVEARSGVDTLDFHLISNAETLSLAETQGQGAALDLKGSVPYPRKGEAKAKGPVTIEGGVQLAALTGKLVQGQGVDADIKWSGQLDGWIDRFVLNGHGTLTARAQSLASGDQQLTSANLGTNNLAVAISRGQSGQPDDRLNWRIEGPARLQAASLRTGETVIRQADLSSSRILAGGDGKLFEAQGPLSLTANGLETGDLKLSAVRGQFQLDAVRGLATRIALRGGLSANGRFDGLGAVSAEDAPQLARLKQAARDFRLSAPNLAFAQTNRGNALQLLAPVQAVSANGASLKLEPMGGPLLQLAQGGPAGSGRLTLSGDGMPALGVDIERWQAGRDGFSARLKANGTMDFDPVDGIAVKTAGLLSVRNGVTDYRADGCVDVRAASVAIEANALTDIAGQLCADARPLFSMRNGRWQLAGRLQQADLSAPFAGVDLSAGRGRLDIVGNASGMALSLTDIDATLSDVPTAPDAKVRFNPAQATGAIKLAGGAWAGDLELTREGYAVADLKLDHDVQSGAGSLSVRTGRIEFAQGALQPVAISPMLADFVGNPATGAIDLFGQFRWTKDGVTSDGQLDIADMSFATPVGQIEALNGNLVFTDLLNLTMADDATFTARRLNAFIPVENLTLRARTRGKAFAVNEVALGIGGGRVRASNVLVPFDRKQDITGTIHLENLQVNDLLDAANLRDKASFQAALTGDLGFRYNEQLGWQIESGDLTSSQGRLEIDPEVLTGVATGSGELTTNAETNVQLPPNAMQDLAYQALESLAIDRLHAQVQSQPGGRLGINFVIDGRHDPEVRKELRVSLIDLIRGNLLNQRLDLPSGTPVILRLNTSWNANELATEIFNVMRRQFEDQQASSAPAVTATPTP